MLPTDTGRTISAGLRGHDNALGLIRLVLALAVLVSHTWPLGGFGHDPGGTITRGQTTLGGLSVAGFFAISGYLITKSGMSADVVQFLWRRVLRIFPAFLLVLLLTSLVLGPVIWTLDGHPPIAYFGRSGASPWHYIASNWTLAVHSFGVRDVFQFSTPYGRETGASVLNGSTWTLEYEWACYIMVAILLVVGVLRRARSVILVVAGAILAAQIIDLITPGALGGMTNSLFLTLAAPFAVGAVFAVYSRVIPLTAGWGLTAGVVLIGTLLLGGYAVIGVPAGVYFILWLGSAIPGRLRRVGQTNDISYGVYLFAFPVQQTLAYAGLYRLGVAPMILVAAAIVLGLSWLSWRFIERPAMSLKGWGPGRGLAFWVQRFRRSTPAPDAADAAADGTAPPAPAPGAAEISRPLRTAAGEPASPPA
ncbi:acyltransferase family protein [Leifsonia sp. LS-T14]|uniref:acyltransferase family protein n=1 Tax=unclassified Leifsonia TaxID=2663824 RepID=UPI0035A5FE04